jgi:hypothetical protein
VKFTGTLAEADGNGRYVECPFDSRTEFGEGRPPVVGTVNGTPFRTRLMVYGGRTYLGLTKAVREAAGIELGDQVRIEVELDSAPREVDVPAELAMALEQDGPARTAFDGLSFTHRKEYARWVGEAKRPETRERRATKATQMLTDGTKHP